MGMGENPVILLNMKIGGNWMFTFRSIGITSFEPIPIIRYVLKAHHHIFFCIPHDSTPSIYMIYIIYNIHIIYNIIYI